MVGKGEMEAVEEDEREGGKEWMERQCDRLFPAG